MDKNTRSQTIPGATQLKPHSTIDLYGAVMPTSRDLARGQALGRVAAGVALMVAPRQMAGAWIGARAANRKGTAVIITAMGARDLGLGLGTARAVGEGYGAGPWIAAGVLADATDLAATWRARRELPLLGATGVALLAAGSTLLGVWLRTELD